MTKVVIPYRPHDKGREFHNNTARFRILDWGRRAGKDRASVMETIKCIAQLLGEDRPASLVPKVHWWYVAPNFPMSRQVWNELLAYTPRELIRRIDRSELYIEFHGGGLLELKSADKPDNLVGVGLDGMTMTEAARVQEEAYTENIRPTLSSPLRGPGMAGKGLVILNSTPKGKNWYYRMYVRGCPYLDASGNPTPNPTEWLNPEHDPEYWSSHALSIDNPHFDRTEWETAKRELPEQVFDQEYRAEFLADSAGVFRNVEACATLPMDGFPKEPEPGRSYAVGVDLARLVDFTVVTVMDKATREVVHFERFNQVKWEYQKSIIKTAAKKYNDAAILIDSTAIGDPIVEQLQDELGGNYPIEGYRFTQDSKERVIQNLQIALQEKTVAYPPISELLTELRAYEYEFTRNGRFRYNAAPGFHDDCVISLGLALLGCQVEDYETEQFNPFY